MNRRNLRGWVRPSRHSSRRRFSLLLALLLTAFAGSRAPAAEQPAVLPGTARLEWPEEDLSARLMDGAHLFVERKIAESAGGRAARWARDFSSPEAYGRSVQPNRERFRAMIGAVDPRLPPAMERYGDDSRPALVVETERFAV